MNKVLEIVMREIWQVGLPPQGGGNMSVYEAMSLMIRLGILAVGIVTVVISIVRLRK